MSKDFARLISESTDQSWVRRQLGSAGLEPGRPVVFDPRTPVSPLGARLLAASNGLHSHATDGVPASEPFTTRHGRTS